MSKRKVQAWLIDMDGVLIHEGQVVPGAPALIAQWEAQQVPFLILTNNSIYPPDVLSQRLHACGIPVPTTRIWTSALTTAHFLRRYAPTGTAFVVGEAGMVSAMREAGFTLTEDRPDFVVLGEAEHYSFEAISQAIRLISQGARFIATTPNVTTPTPEGVVPAAGSVAKMISAATRRAPYTMGKPNQIMFRSALRYLGCRPEQTGMVGDRMDADIIPGIEAGMHTVLVLTGVSTRQEAAQSPLWPDEIVASVAELIE